ncbi:MAG: sugar phosphate isomerase/epimerase [Clostridia bacterium]|nr:sugar phosphate isomerase/epimerase [Clostridia bacterium]
MKAPFCIWSKYYRDGSAEDAVLEFAKDGVEYIELAHEHGAELLERRDDHVETGRTFAAFLATHGLRARQGHLRFPARIASDPAVIDYLVRQIELYAAIGIRCAVLHTESKAEMKMDGEEWLSRNVEALRTLLSRVEHVDITICLENMRSYNESVEILLEIIDRVGSPKLGICLDTGHLNNTHANTHREFILKAGKHLKALHIADNEGERDQHMMPFGRGNVDFEAVVAALREIDYEGMFNYEIPGESGCPNPVRHAKVAYLRAGYAYLMR